MKETTGEREAQKGETGGGGGGGIKGAAAVAAKGQKMNVFTMSTKHNTGAQEYRSSLAEGVSCGEEEAGCTSRSNRQTADANHPNRFFLLLLAKTFRRRSCFSHDRELLAYQTGKKTHWAASSLFPSVAIMKMRPPGRIGKEGFPFLCPISARCEYLPAPSSSST